MDCVIARALLVCLLGFVSTPSMSEEVSELSAPGVVLSSGVEGSSYWSAGARLQVAAKKMDLAVDNLPSSGSLENLDRLLDGSSPVNLTFAQADAVQHYLNQHRSAGEKLEVLENIGLECVFVVTGIDSAIRTDEDLRNAENLRLGIASDSSGMAVTFDYMASQIPQLADTDILYGDTLALMDDLNASDATVDAIMMAHRPREHSAEVDKALANPDRFRFVELSDDLLIEELWNGRKIYRTMKLAMPGTAKPVKTICVPGLLVANKRKLTIEQRNQLSDLVNFHWMQIYATQ